MTDTANPVEKLSAALVIRSGKESWRGEKKYPVVPSKTNGGAALGNKVSEN